MTAITITLRSIKSHNPCKSGWKAVKKPRGGKLADMDAPFPLADVLDSNDLSDTLWCLQCLPEHDALWRKYAVWCARQVEHLLTDERSKTALDAAWRHSEGEASDEELGAAWDAARGAACDAARGAARYAAWAAAWAAAWGAAWGAARYAAGDAAGDAARYAAGDAAGDAARGKQEAKLRQILNAGAWVDDDPVQGGSHHA